MAKVIIMELTVEEAETLVKVCREWLRLTNGQT